MVIKELVCILYWFSKGIVNFDVQHVPKSTGSTELTEPFVVHTIKWDFQI